MQQSTTTTSAHWKDRAITAAEAISDAFDVVKAYGAHIANWVLFFCLVANLIEMVSPGFEAFAGLIIVGVQSISLDIAGFGLTAMAASAKRRGDEKSAMKANIMGWTLISVMSITVGLITLAAFKPEWASGIQMANQALMFVRVIVTVFYGHIVHQIREEGTAHENRLAELETEMSTLKLQFKAKEQEAADLKLRATTLQQQLNKATQEGTTLSQQLSAEQQRAASLLAELETGNGDTATLRRELAKARGEIEALQGQVSGKQHEIAGLQDQLGIEQQRAANLLAELETGQGDTATFRRELASARIEIETLQGQLGGKQREIAGLQEQLEKGQDWQATRARQLLEAEQQQVARLQQQFHEEQTKVVSLHQDLQAANLQKAGLQTQITALLEQQKSVSRPTETPARNATQGVSKSSTRNTTQGVSRNAETSARNTTQGVSKTEVETRTAGYEGDPETVVKRLLDEDRSRTHRTISKITGIPETTCYRLRKAYLETLNGSEPATETLDETPKVAEVETVS